MRSCIKFNSVFLSVFFLISTNFASLAEEQCDIPRDSSLIFEEMNSGEFSSTVSKYNLIILCDSFNHEIGFTIS